MAFLGDTFDAADLPEGNSNYDPIPAGWYTTTITDAELRDTKNGTGQYIAVRYDITGPEHQGRVVFGNINIKNASQKAEEIGRQHLGELMRSIGLARVTDTDELIGGQLQIKVGIRKSEEYGDQNEVKGFKAMQGAMTSAPAPAQTAPAQAPAGGKAPWQK